MPTGRYFGSFPVRSIEANPALLSTRNVTESPKPAWVLRSRSEMGWQFCRLCGIVLTGIPSRLYALRGNRLATEIEILEKGTGDGSRAGVSGAGLVAVRIGGNFRIRT